MISIKQVLVSAVASLLLGFAIWAVITGKIGVNAMETDSVVTSDHSGRAPLSPGRPNRLINEKSPYLLQHAHNPVDWYPWGEEAFEKARKEDKPIFLSIGYSTCHWCHVMERESFEDPEVAKLMNDTWVSIKVDREERPDIDHVYMTVCQMLTGAGGWPLNIVMTPDKKPFFAGTYFPKETRLGRIGMLDLAARIKELWSTRRSDLLQSSNKIMAALQEAPNEGQGAAPGLETMKTAFEQLSQRFDENHGGFSNAPKFPAPHNMLFLLRYWKRTTDSTALAMVEKTLADMRLGGVYDHVGFGFHRYSTDPEWLVPHFEKMLYDQAMLAMVYSEAYQATGKKDYAGTVREILTYILRDMTDPGGGFYSAEDADSEGEEGKFYVWNQDEIRKALDKTEAELVMRVFNVRPDGNFREEATGKITGTNILHSGKPLGQIAADLNMKESELREHLETARRKLFHIREQRIHPHKDDKILTDWNGLMIAALAKAAQALDEPDYATAASNAADFILSNMRDRDGRLLHRFREGAAGLPAHVDDYAFFIWGLIELYEATFDVRWLRTALELNGDFVARFWDEKSGGFYFTAKDRRDLPVRKKEIYDGATPSGNSVATLNLLRLGRMTGATDPEGKAEEIGRRFSGDVGRLPSAFTMLLSAFEFSLGPSHEVVIAGRTRGEDTTLMLKHLRRGFFPNKVVLFRPEDQNDPEIAKIADFTKFQKMIRGKATAYVCRNYSCEFPTTDPNKMIELLSNKQP